MAITQNHVINIQPGVSAPLVIHCSQGDTGTQINLTVVNGDEEFDCSSYACSVHGVRSDGGNWGPITCTVSGSTVCFSLTSAMTAIAGPCLAEISVGTVGTANFAILVENATFSLGVTYTEDTSVYQSILNYIMNAVQNIQNQYAVTNAKLDTAISAATQDSEVQGIRVKADGTSAATAGNAVREQFTELKNNLTRLNDGGLILKDDVIAENVTDWLDKHPEATTTVQDWSLTYKKLVKGTLGFVMPEMYGARGDGVTDDTQALRDAFNASGFVKGTGVYAITEPLDIITPTYIDVDLKIVASASMAYMVHMHSESASLESMTRGNLKLTLDGQGLATDGFRYSHFYGVSGNINVSNFNGVGVTGRYINENCGENRFHIEARNYSTAKKSGTVGLKCGQDDTYTLFALNMETVVDIAYGGCVFDLIHGWTLSQACFSGSRLVKLSTEGTVLIRTLVCDTVETVLYPTALYNPSVTHIKNLDVLTNTSVTNDPCYLWDLTLVESVLPYSYPAMNIECIASGNLKIYSGTTLPYVLVNGLEVDPTTLALKTREAISVINFKGRILTNLDYVYNGTGCVYTSTKYVVSVSVSRGMSIVQHISNTMATYYTISFTREIGISDGAHWSHPGIIPLRYITKVISKPDSGRISTIDVPVAILDAAEDDSVMVTLQSAVNGGYAVGIDRNLNAVALTFTEDAYNALPSKFRVNIAFFVSYSYIMSRS